MDCQTARTLIDTIPAGSPEWLSAEGMAAERHLAVCPDCQSVAHEVRELDNRISRLMADVPIPAGFPERLRAIAVPSTTSANPVVSRRIGQRVLGALIALGLVMTIGVSLWWFRPAQFTVAQYATAAADWLNARTGATPGVFDDSFDSQLRDERWQSVCEGPAVGWDLDGRPGHDMAAYRIRIDDLRMTGWLLVIPVDRVSDLPESHTPEKIAYTQAAWRTENHLLICVSDRTGIERLIAAWSQTAA